MIRVITVGFRNGRTLPAFLDSLASRLKTAAEVVVWANDPTSAEAARLWWAARSDSAPFALEILGDGRNIGFSKACNLAASAPTARGAPKAFLFLNPDSRLLTPVTDADIEALLAHDALVGLRIFNNDEKTVQASARGFPSLRTSLSGREGLLTRVWPSNPWSQGYLRPDLALRQGPHRVDWVSGSGLLAPKSVWDRLGGFDERYFLYVEDVDLGRKALSSGVPVVHDPRIAIAHEIGGSRMGARAALADFHHHRGMWLYYLKWTHGWRLALAPVVLAGIAARFLLRRLA